jgi:hypothetical protein
MNLCLKITLGVLFTIYIGIPTNLKLAHPLFSDSLEFTDILDTNIINIDSLRKSNRWNIDSLVEDAKRSIQIRRTVSNDSIYKKKKLHKCVEQIRSDLNRNVFPSLLYNPCIDQEDANYYYYNSHQSISLRIDILNSLDSQELRKLILLADKKKLKMKCNYKSYIDDLPHQYKSTWELLKMRKKGVVIKNNFK